MSKFSKNKINAKRKISELIIDDLEEENSKDELDSQSSVVCIHSAKGTLRRKETESSIDIESFDSSRENSQTKVSTKTKLPLVKKPSRGNLITTTFVNQFEELNNNNNNKRPRSRFMSDDEISIDERLNELTKHSTVATKNNMSNKFKHSNYDLDDLINEESKSNVVNKQQQPIDKTKSKQYTIDNLIDDIESNNNDEAYKDSKRSKLIDSILSSTSSLSLSDKSIDILTVDNTFDFEEAAKNNEEVSIIEDFDLSPTSQNNRESELYPKVSKAKKGTDWLKELDSVDTTNTNVTILNQTKKSPSTLLTVNTSNFFLNENDLKNRKSKYVKNGYAEKLQKILIRQVSSLNFIKHNMNKTGQFRNVKNVIKLVPFHVYSAPESQFSLLYGVIVDDDEQKLNSTGYLLISNDTLESAHGSFKKFYENTNLMNKKILVKIYPPWKQMLFKDKCVYFCISFIELKTVDKTAVMSFAYEKLVTTDIKNLNCPSSCNYSIDCSIDLFDIKKFLKSMNETNYVLPQSNSKTTNPLVSQRYLFFTQTDSSYFKDTSSFNSKNDSILEALENIGYYGFLTFRATVQRCGLVKCTFNFSNQISYQQTELTQSTQHSINIYKKQLIVNDIYGMFALVMFPFDDESININESSSYQFNSLKFIDKQSLNSAHNNSLDEQIKFLWNDMNSRKDKNSKQLNIYHPKTIFVFEYMNDGRSSIEFLKKSTSFVELNTFETFQAFEEFSSKMISNTTSFLNLKNIIILKLNENIIDEKFKIYFIEKTLKPSKKIQVLEFKSIKQIHNAIILDSLRKNYMLSNCTSSNQVILLKNISIHKRNQDDIPDNTITDSEYIDLVIKEIKSKNDDYNLKLFEFVKFSGRIMCISQEDFKVDFYCLSCSNKQTSKLNEPILLQTNKLSFDYERKEWHCGRCDTSFCSNLKNIPVIIDIKLRISLNCIGISRLVKLNLHHETTKLLIPDVIEEMLLQSSPEDIQEKLCIIEPYLLEKQYGPAHSFVYSLNDTEVYAQELHLLKNNYI